MADWLKSVLPEMCHNGMADMSRPPGVMDAVNVYPRGPRQAMKGLD